MVANAIERVSRRVWTVSIDLTEQDGRTVGHQDNGAACRAISIWIAARVWG
jgi:hypothetical protein